MPDHSTSLNQTRLTTLDVPRRDIGREAAQAIVELLRGHAASPDLCIELTRVQGTTT